MKISEKKAAARAFAEKWKDKGYEKGESNKFWLELLQDVLGVTHVFDFITFEEQVHLDHTSFIDAWIPLTHVLIEQKSADKDLKKKIRQSDGTELTPFQQAKRYSMELPYSNRPRWIITCNFQSFLVYDMENPSGEPQEILLKNLGKEFYRLEFIVDPGNKNIEKEMEISLKAGDLVGEIYDAFSKQYLDITNEHSIQSLNKLCVRLVFCLYAEDACLFGEKGAFHDYLSSFDYKHQRDALINLFKVLNTPYKDRDPYMDEKLANFPYVNGGMFAEDDIEIPQFTEEISKLLLSKAADDFDWSDISPTIFGAVFESTLNPETRRSGGMHYTSIENIHKVIDPLFLDDLKNEFNEIKKLKRDRDNKLEQFQSKLASIKFLDPACGSGNFLTETYISLRRIENEIISILNRGNAVLGFEETKYSPIKVSIDQFYGIEINDFAVSVAKTALWIAEAQMFDETKHIVISNIDFFPLKTYTNIVEANAITYNWNDLIDAKDLNYIMGNPPFIGARLLNESQRNDVNYLFNGWNNVGNLDYVSCWFKKTFDYIKESNVSCAFVSTSSIVEGEAVGYLWKPLFELGLHFNFAHQEFKWTSEANQVAQVYCVIIGFSSLFYSRKKYLFSGILKQEVNNINAYLQDADNIFIERRSKPICDVPKMHKGAQPTDGGHLIIEEKDYDDFIKKEPNSVKYIKKLIGADEFLNNKKRFCLWLVDASPAELRNMPHVMERIKLCKEMRLAAKDKATKKLADRPHLFRETYNYDSYVVVPMVSPTSRRYIPFGFFGKDTISTNLNLVIENASNYHFGILSSRLHMCWVKSIGGKMGNAYRYSAGVVYNNFPWPKIKPELKEKISNTAQQIQEARALYPEASLADLYDDLVMPIELRKAHQANDNAVMDAYGFSHDLSESEILAKLMELYVKLTD